MFRTLPLVVLLLVALLGCGGTATSSSPRSGPSGSAGAPAAPAIVQVAAGQTAAGVSITVPAPTGTSPNAQDLGVAPPIGPASAFNTGDVIHRGASARVVLFGPGLSSSMQVSILGPSDIQVANIQGVTATDNTPGVSFVANVSSTAALGARTVVLVDTNGNITTFTGGLEVIP